MPLLGQESPKKAEEGSAQEVRYQPVADAEKTHQGDFVESRQLLHLPVDTRNYLCLAVLTAGVTHVNDFVSITDTALVQAPQSGLSFGGNNGRGNIFWLDGGENYINTGGVRPSVSQEAVAEFRVERANYSAEFGGGIGGIVNILSRSGGSKFHGSLFGFLRHRDIQARNYFDPGKSSFTRTQVGAVAGGPIKKDRTYYFASFERLQRRENGIVAVGRDRGPFQRLRATQQSLANFFKTTGDPELLQLAEMSERLLLTTNFPSTLALFDSNRGTFPFREAGSVGSIRFDHRFSDNHNGFLRLNVAAGGAENSQVEGLRGVGRGLVSDFTDQTALFNDTYVISAHLVSESRLSINRNRFNVANQDRVGPSIDIAGYGLFGKDRTLPSNYGEWHGQAQQTIFYTPGRHSIRFGTDINPVRAASLIPVNRGGGFTFGEYLPLGQFYNSLTGDPATASRVAARLTASGQRSLVRGLDIPLTAIQVFNLGIPSVYIQGFDTGQWNGWFHRFNFFLNDVFTVRPGLTLNMGVRYELDAPPDPLHTSATNFGPRIALAWAPGDAKTVVRAGYGIFYLRHQSQVSSALGSQGKDRSSQILVPLSGLAGTRNPRTGRPLTSADVYQTLAVGGILGVRPIERQDLIPLGLSLTSDFPVLYAFTAPTDFRSAYAQQASFEVERAISRFAVSVGYNFNRAAHLPRLRDLLGGRGPGGAQSLTYESAANSYYHAMVAQVTRRYGSRLLLNANYTFGKSIDEGNDFSFLPNDSNNPRADRARSAFDQKHRFIASAVASLPRGLVLAPVGTVSSGRPFNVVTGLEGAIEGYRRPVGAGRNIGQGPSFISMDMRVSRRLALGDRLALEIIAEGFNLMNRTNFRRLNNTVGDITVDDLPRPLVGVRGDTLEPFAFVSAFNPRLFQVALKVHF